MRRVAPLCSLILAVTIGMAQDPAKDFESFCRRFFAERDFQMNHISFPVVSVTAKDEDESLDSLAIARGKWRFIFHKWGSRYNAPSEAFCERIYDNFALIRAKHLRNTKERVVVFQGIDNGIWVGYFFKLKRGQWMLVRLEDLSN